LKAARRAEKVPDLSYDIDGDGAVGPTDYFVAKHFSKERDYRLNTGERKNVVDALESSWLDKFAFGFEQAGPTRLNVVKQIRGKVFTGDNHADINNVYPPHFNSGKVPNHSSRTEMLMARKATFRNEANAMKDAHDADNPWSIVEPDVVQDSMVDKPRFRTRSEVREHRRQTAREKSGLDPAESHMNPDRDLAPGLGYVENPAAKTRTELRQTRKENNQAELAIARWNGDSDFIPQEARHTRIDYEDFEMRRGSADAQTATKMKEERRRANIEYNMARFGKPPKEPARFSDHDAAWWRLRGHYNEEPPTSLLKEQRDAALEKITGKVTSTSVSRKVPTPRDLEKAAGYVPTHDVPREENEMGQMTVPRWTAGFVPPGVMAKIPRVFDNVGNNADGFVDGVKQAPTLSVDEAHLDSFSSFEVIRKSASQKDPFVQQNSIVSDKSKGSTKEGKLQEGKLQQEGSITAVSEVEFAGPDGVSPHPPHVPSRQLSARSKAGSRANAASRASSFQSSGRKIYGKLAGEDLSMTARLGRLSEASPARVPMPRESGPPSPMSLGPPALSAEDRPTQGRPEAGSRNGANAPTAPPPRDVPQIPQALAVRTGGFQWVNSKALAVPEAPSMHATPRSSKRNLSSGANTPLGSRTAR